MDIVGLKPEQILVLINNTTDGTESAVRAVSSRVLIETQSSVIEKNRTHEAIHAYAIPRQKIIGKGAAMFAASLVLKAMHRDDADRIFFLDADITNVAAVDPIRHIMLGWKEHPETGLVKLAAQGRNNEGFHAFFGIPGNPFVDLGCLQWPLCGQMSVRWGDLRAMRLTNGYSVEVAMMVNLLRHYDFAGQPPVLTEVEIGEVLRDKRNDDGVHVRMYRNIMALLHDLWLRGGRSPQELTASEVADFNQWQNKHGYWVPQPNGQGANKKEHHSLDVILPNMAECG